MQREFLIKGVEQFCFEKLLFYSACMQDVISGSGTCCVLELLASCLFNIWDLHDAMWDLGFGGLKRRIPANNSQCTV